MADVDLKIIRYLRDNPGANLEKTGNALAPFYSSTWTKTRVHALITIGTIRAEISKTGRYRLFVADPDALEVTA